MSRVEAIDPMDLPRSSLDSGDPKGNDRVFQKNSDVIAGSTWEGRLTFSKKYAPKKTSQYARQGKPEARYVKV